jgi:long-chain fatty acid transport protein
MTTRPFVALAFALACALPARRAAAGGFETPDNGTEALGRGGAFVAKADDGTAIEYNIAGLARQEGIRLTADLNLVSHDIAFTRSGTYPGDPTDMRTPYAGQRFPTMHDTAGIFPAPFLAISANLGALARHSSFAKRWTIAVGAYGPSSAGTHNYGVGAPMAGQTDDPPALAANGSPAPSRYDLSKTNLVIAFPTLAVAYKFADWLDAGLAWQVVYASFDLANANITALGSNLCPQADYAGCDSYGRANLSGTSFSSSSDIFKGTVGEFSPGLSSFGWLLSLMLHPTSWLDVGWTLRPQIDVRAEGTLHAVSAPVAPTKLADSPVTFSATLPTWVRLGGRVVSRYPDGTEKGDLELDLVWEGWSAERADHIHAENFTLGKNEQLDVDVIHNYKDTLGARLGGAWNFRINDRARIIGRLGFFFDSSATDPRDTRIDFNTLAKYGFTVGAGVRFRGVTLNAAYAFVYSPPRTVNDSEILAISATNGTSYTKADARIPVGNGLYEPMTQIISVGLTVNFNEAVSGKLMAN